MTPPSPTLFHRLISVKDAAIIGFTILIFMVLNHAGSQIASGAAALGGLVGILGHRLPHPRDWPSALWAGLAFLIWCVFSALWSPYDSERTLSGPIRLGVGVPLYGLFVYVMSVQSERAKTVWRRIVIPLVSLSALVFALDLSSGYAITRLGDPDAVSGSIEQNLGHGLSVLLLLMPVFFILIWKEELRRKILFGFVMFWTAIAVASSGNFAAALALLGMVISMLCAGRFPAITLKAVFLLPIFAILLAPLLGLIAMGIGDQAKAAMPFSWEWRAETWAYLGQEIAANPFIGSGLDSLRAATATFDARGFEGLSVVPMHAHNLGLHIWSETGFVGAILAALALWLTQNALQKSAALTRSRLIAICGLVSVITIFYSLSYSAWQDWWLGAIAIVISFIYLAPEKTSGAE